MTAVRTLDRPPGAATLYPRAVFGTFARPWLRRVPLVGGSTPKELPELELTLAGAELDPDHVARYAQVCGFPLRDALPVTYLHNLAFPLAMALMTDGAFPFGVIGLVHVANAIEQRRPVRIGERPSLRVWAADLRPHERGRQFDVLAEASIDGEVVWVDRSTYLRVGGAPKADGDRPKAGGKGSERASAPEPEAIWAVPGDIGRRFGAVSGDRNPIHLHPLSAKAFGMPSAIAHGMWLKARCLAALDADLPEAFTVDVRFKRPVVLPAKVGFSSARSGDELTFALHDARKGVPHLEGRVTA